MSEQRHTEAALYAIDSLLAAVERGQPVIAEELRLVRALVVRAGHGYRRAISDLRDEAARIHADQPVTARDLRRTAEFLESKIAGELPHGE